MIPFLLLGAVAVVGAVALAAFWKEIVQWIKKVYNKLPDSVKQNLQGAKAFLEKLGTAIKNIMKYYSYKLTKTTKHAKRHFWLNDVCTCHGLLPSHSA